MEKALKRLPSNSQFPTVWKTHVLFERDAGSRDVLSGLPDLCAVLEPAQQGYGCPGRAETQHLPFPRPELHILTGATGCA